MTNTISIIGSGYSSMVAACCLADKGLDVTIYEKNEMAGGRASQFEEQGFIFDMGPSWYWMPEVFENFFNRFGKSSSDYYELVQLDPGYQVLFDGEENISIPADKKSLLELFESIEPGSAEKLQKFLAEAEYKYRVGIDEYVWKPGKSILEFADMKVLKSFTKLQMLSSVSSSVKSLFKNKRLQQILEFPVLFLGSMPNRIPALYTLMNHADLTLGTWSSIQSGSEKFESDFVIAGADYHHFDREVLPAKYSNYSESYWDKREMAPSSLLFFLGFDTKLKGLEHHNLFFDSSFDTHVDEIYKSPQWPSKPLFYICAPSKTDDNISPEGYENVFALIPLAPGLKENKSLHEKYLNEIIGRIEEQTGSKIKDNLVYKKSFSVSDFKSRYNAFKGNAYGLANTLKQTAILKPKYFNKNLDNLYYTGQLTVPGPGMPPAIISGQLVADQFLKNIKAYNLWTRFTQRPRKSVVS